MKQGTAIRPEVERAALTLSSKDRLVDLLRHQVFHARENETEREILYSEARRRGLLLTYEFSGVPAEGVSRRDAITTLMSSTFRKCLGLFRRNFGSSARFFSRPKQFRDLGVDFYWKAALIGIVITGPTFDDLRRADKHRTRDRDEVLQQLCSQRNTLLRIANDLSVLIIPYYDVWHRPTAVVTNVREVLVNSGQYSRLKM